jgi:hypothetical protein
MRAGLRAWDADPVCAACGGPVQCFYIKSISKLSVFDIGGCGPPQQAQIGVDRLDNAKMLSGSRRLERRPKLPRSYGSRRRQIAVRCSRTRVQDWKSFTLNARGRNLRTPRQEPDGVVAAR